MTVQPYDTDRVLTLPNMLSFLRLLGVPLFFWLVVGARADVWAVVLLAVAGATDWVDGFLARRWHQTSRVGQLLDPIADRLYILTIVLALVLRDIVPWALLAILVARDLVLAVMMSALKRRGVTGLPVNFVGKAATFSLLYAFPLVLLGAGGEQVWRVACLWLGWGFAIVGTALYWTAGVMYLRQGTHILRQPLPPTQT